MAIALITGASSGIGLEFAKQLADSGEVDACWLIARRADKLHQLAQELPVPCRAIVADLTKEAGIQAVQSALRAEQPSVKWLICAAGYGVFGNYAEVPIDTAMGMIDLNIKALVQVTYMTIPYMPAGGHIVEMGSGSCFTPLPHFNIYAASKAFVLHFGKALRFEVAPRKLSVTVFCPGWVDTDFLDAMLPQGIHGPRSLKPLLRVDTVVRKAIRAARKGRVLYATNWYTKLQHLLFKLLPDSLLTRAWMGMQQ